MNGKEGVSYPKSNDHDNEVKPVTGQISDKPVSPLNYTTQIERRFATLHIGDIDPLNLPKFPKNTIDITNGNDHKSPDHILFKSLPQDKRGEQPFPEIPEQVRQEILQRMETIEERLQTTDTIKSDDIPSARPIFGETHNTPMWRDAVAMTAPLPQFRDIICNSPEPTIQTGDADVSFDIPDNNE